MIHSLFIFLGLLAAAMADLVTLKVVAKDNFVYGYATTVSGDEDTTALGFVNMFLAMGKNFVAPKFYFDSNMKLKSDKNF